MKSLLSKNILITGGLGFIGSNLARRLVNSGASVTLLDNLYPNYGGNLFNINDFEDKVNVIIGDVRDSDLVNKLVKNKDYLFNLAGQTSHLDSMENPFDDLEINSKAQLSILEACKNYNTDIKIVFTSTRQIYGKPDYLPVDETHSIKPVDVNGINKYSGESFHTLYNHIYGIKSAILRLTNTYGPGMRIKDSRQTFLGVWIRNALKSEPLLIYGDGLQLRDFNYVDDVVDALLLVALDDESNGDIFNLGSDQVVNLVDLSKIFRDINPEIETRLVKFPDKLKKIDIGDYYGNFSKINNKFKWKPKVSLEEGLRVSLAYYGKNLNYFLENKNDLLQ
ncbi:NAD-dependent epimerase/dehydratase family protein [Candidatus Methylopumilus universalis]|jgi:UDP-glucose 4-epimerase|uniref:NAD-dependent epimerase/dehydratase family protein n=1 Tax=Candidatus Methylopumilus universalis TaxID=2588536 RepID=UPI00111D9D60|nr:NAD-dependent epimerase/dehydratase family protein [Candidatus Methylopumilus universalis]